MRNWKFDSADILQKMKGFEIKQGRKEMGKGGYFLKLVWKANGKQCEGPSHKTKGHRGVGVDKEHTEERRGE
jgi:hypothetical protein